MGLREVTLDGGSQDMLVSFFFFGKILFIYWDAWVAKSVKPMGQVMIPGPRDGAPCQGTSFSLSLLLMVSLTISLSQINKMFKKVFFI